MIRNNLAVLMAQRGTKISKIAADTGIARSTLNAIAQNESKMIQLETIDKLCQELGVTPCDFFEYLDFNYEVLSESSTEEISYKDESFVLKNYMYLIIKFKRGHQTKGYKFPLIITSKPFDTDEWFDASTDFFVTHQGIAEHADQVNDYISSMSIAFKTAFLNHMANSIVHSFKEILKEQGQSLSKKSNKYLFDLGFIQFEEKL